jgi:riboflavin kinase/FMN adenylyltransferase
VTLLRDIPQGALAAGMVLALGNFDGVHRGHRALLSACKAQADALGLPAAALTFEPHPRRFFAPASPPLRIFSAREKIAALRACGMDHVIMLRFNARLAGTSAEDFVLGLLREKLRAQHVFTGENFAFGKGRGGDSAFLSALAAREGFGYSAFASVLGEGGEVISSSAIRAHLAAGEVEQATRLLGAPYRVCGHAQHGEKRGRKLGFPTLNLCMTRRFLPRAGVYAAQVKLGGEHYNAIANIGIKPSFGQFAPRLEAHCFGLSREVYGTLAEVTLKRFLRDEKKFDSIEALKAQIAADIASLSTKERT